MQIEQNQIYNMDCLEGMKFIPDKTIDMILCDLPYGTTQNKWDSIIDLKKLWLAYERILKDDCGIILFAQTPFDKVLGVSKLEWLKYEFIWEKIYGTGFLNANRAPLKNHENILIFQNGKNVYNPQMENGEKPYKCKKGRNSSSYGKIKEEHFVTVNKGQRFPKTILKFKHDTERLHPNPKTN